MKNITIRKNKKMISVTINSLSRESVLEAITKRTILDRRENLPVKIRLSRKEAQKWELKAANFASLFNEKGNLNLFGVKLHIFHLYGFDRENIRYCYSIDYTQTVGGFAEAVPVFDDKPIRVWRTIENALNNPIISAALE